MADQRDFRRRLMGAFFLGAALALVIVGETLLTERLRHHPVAFLVFWMACFILLGLAILVAVVDMAVVRRRLRREQRELLENTVREIQESQSPKAPGRSRPPKNSK